MCVCGCAFILVELEARQHLFYDGVGAVEAQFANRYSSFSEFKVSFAEVMLEIVPCIVLWVGAFPRPDVIFEYSLPIEDNEGEVCFLTLSQFCFGRFCVFNQVVDGVEDDVNWLGRIVDHRLDGGCLVAKLLWGNVSIVVV